MIKERLSPISVEKGRIDVLDGAIVVIDANGVQMHLPVGANRRSPTEIDGVKLVSFLPR